MLGISFFIPEIKPLIRLVYAALNFSTSMLSSSDQIKVIFRKSKDAP